VHDNQKIMENTMVAFERAAAVGIWGIELDVRWTRDGQAVVCHDPDLMRVFGVPAAVDTLNFDQLRAHCPLVPTLNEVVARFGGQLHLMIELKPISRSPDTYPYQRLGEILEILCPVRDYHLMALVPHLLAGIDWAPGACLPIARLQSRAFSRLALDRGYAGLCGHYALLGNSHLNHHHRCGQRLGTGFIASKACLYREVNRGVNWLFSNHAEEMQRICLQGYNAQS
jgi:glycerophosphoryl diester phosphodiesterase